MDLVVTRHAIARGIEDEARASNPRGIARQQRNRPTYEPYLVPARRFGEEVLYRPATTRFGGIFFGDFDLVRLVLPEDAEILRQSGQLGAFGRCLLHQPSRGCEIDLDFGSRNHLNRSDA